MRRRLAALALAALLPGSASALQWQWRYTAPGIEASGTMTTDDAPAADGSFRILALTGQRNGAAITGLQPAGTAIPGNEPYQVDNRLRPTAPQLTKSGFGFALGDGGYANPFFADFRSPPAYLEFCTQPNGVRTELPIGFTATPR